ncbi:ABC transporter ATP-binding protein [Nocardioides albidus]|uniref:ABC transporter ATP-binding protein n=1 Tax=Nocardioides albidus TaxID=1517589 RepID=A0A5C4W1D9_9ACTN|nr:ABC transporter ATP-binding protein [Nocardioides albidus]TNM41179.1 ABC transporter ATP-binding protein [Nocardioides albidus]
MTETTTGATRATTPTAIQMSGVTVEFADPLGGTKQVLKGIDLTVPAGQFIALVGKSGCGKTTLLNMVAALVRPTTGTVTVGGETPKAARRNLGFMLARDALLPWRTAQGNVEYGLELRGVPKQERRETARRWLEAVHLGGSERLWPWQLSQGMRQRVALARTWALDPDVLLMDEPFAALDVTTRVAVQEEFLRLWQSEQHKTVIFVTHDLGEAIALADRVVLLGEGRVLYDVEVGLERPRDLQTVAGEPRYQEIYNQLRSSI